VSATSHTEMLAVLDDLEDTLDKQIYPQQQKQDFDAPDAFEYAVTITAKQWRAIGRALTAAHKSDDLQTTEKQA
jgi:hypothetical protein